MIVYVVADRRSGEVLSLHHEVDAEGRSVRCREEDVLAALPADVEPDQVAVLSTELDGIPSSRDAVFAVDPERRVVSVEAREGGAGQQSGSGRSRQTAQDETE